MSRRLARATGLPLCILALVAIALPAPAAAQGPAPAPDLSQAAAAILVDARDGSVILEKDPDERRSIASTTKLMTALLSLEQAQPEDVYTAPAYDALAVESKIDLATGERMRVSDLLEALLLESANDAAATLADGVSGSRPAFVEQMNQRAEQLGLDDTSYANPIGLDAPGNFSTARDLATLARRLLGNERFAAIVDSESATLESGNRPRVVANRNGLVAAYRFVDGVKTGFTSEAGYVLVGAAESRLGARVVSVVLGEPSEAARDVDTLALLRHGLGRFRRARPVAADRPVARAAIAHREETAPLVPARGATLVVRRGERLRTRVDAPDELEGELAAGTRVGRISIIQGGRVVRRVPLLTADRVPGAGPLRVLTSTLGTFVVVFVALLLIAVAVLLLGRSRIRRRRDSDRAARRRQRARARSGP